MVSFFLFPVLSLYDETCKNGVTHDTHDVIYFQFIFRVCTTFIENIYSLFDVLLYFYHVIVIQVKKWSNWLSFSICWVLTCLSNPEPLIPSFHKWCMHTLNIRNELAGVRSQLPQYKNVSGRASRTKNQQNYLRFPVNIWIHRFCNILLLTTIPWNPLWYLIWRLQMFMDFHRKFHGNSEEMDAI